MQNTKPKLVVFDMAGTTVQDHNEVESCFAKACESSGLEDVPAERIKSLQGYAKREVFRLLWSERMTNTEHIENMTETAYENFKSILEQHYQNNPVHPTEGTLETFEFLRYKGIKIALTTGFYRKVTDIILEKLGWLKGLNENYLCTDNACVIDFSIASDEVAKGRPSPEMVFQAMKLLEIGDPAEIIKIGDTPVDIAEGRNAGAGLVIGITNGTHTKQALEPHNPDYFLSSMKDFSTLFKNLYD